MNHPLLNMNLGEIISLAERDPVVISQVRSLLPRDWLAPLEDEANQPPPPMSAMSAIQCSIFDNWPNGRPAKSKPYRYAVAIHGWSSAPDEIDFKSRKYAFHATATLFTPDELIAKVAELQSPKLRNPISAEYAEALLELANASDGDLIGPLMKKGGGTGTIYFEGHLIRIPAAAIAQRRVTSADLIAMPDFIDLPGFSPLDAAGNQLTGNAVLQSRYSPHNSLAAWSTAKSLLVEQ